MTPQAGAVRSADIGLRARAHFKVFVPPGRPEGAVGFSEEEFAPDAIQPQTWGIAETPASLACLYGQTAATTGCNPTTLPTTKVATGGSKAIAIVDAYDYPTAASDLAKFSAQFGLPAPTASTFTVTWPSTKPTPDPACEVYGGYNCWALESALDIEMAHSMAPKAHIYLVEAKSNSYTDLFTAAFQAVQLVAAAGGGEVSMSWGGPEFSAETSYDTQIKALLPPGVTFFASTGDSWGVEFPSASPFVVAVGGTTISRNPATLVYQGEIAWEDGGGGLSKYEPRPTFQNGIATTLGNHRGVPDVAAVANPRTGVWVYDSFYTTYIVNGTPTPEPWNIIGGTSVASPLFAGIANRSGHFNGASAELTGIYTVLANSTMYGADYRDVVYGTCGFYQGWMAGKGWDPCTGIGSPWGTAGK
ncbi:MAG: S53 family peptidase [Terracidiphilus sp.]